MGKADAILELFEVDEKAAFQLLYDSYYETLVLFAHHVTGEPLAAEDVVQDCLVDFWVSKRYKTLSSGLDKYIFQAVKFSSLNYIRGTQRKKNLYIRVNQEKEEEESVPREADETDVMEMVYKAIDLLPEERRRIFLMVFVDGMSYKDVAESLQISKNTVKTQLNRSLTFLRGLLKDKYNACLLFFISKK